MSTPSASYTGGSGKALALTSLAWLVSVTCPDT